MAFFSFQCTKALIHFDMQVNVMKVNAANEHGDTPLHLASRWGYGKIKQPGSGCPCICLSVQICLSFSRLLRSHSASASARNGLGHSHQCVNF